MELSKKRFVPSRGFINLKSETDQAPERAKHFSTIPFVSLSGCFAVSFFLFQIQCERSGGLVAKAAK